jgi:hypothetical protein
VLGMRHGAAFPMDETNAHAALLTCELLSDCVNGASDV